MSTPHKWAEAIKAWADGKKIEYRSGPQGQWVAFDLVGWTPGFSNPDLEWRIRPQMPRYRVALMKLTPTSLVTISVNNDEEACRCAENSSFVCWLNDWTEYNV